MAWDTSAEGWGSRVAWRPSPLHRG